MDQKRDEHFVGLWRGPLVRQGRAYQLVVLLRQGGDATRESQQPLAPGGSVSGANLMDDVLVVIQVAL